MTTPDWVSTLEVGERDLIVLTLEIPEEEIDPLIASLHEKFPQNMILFLNPGETIETRPEEEVKELLKALVDHQEYRDHLELAGEQ